IVKQTNGSDNNAAPGPLVLVGDPVTWTYQVTNTGNVPLPSVAVTDDRAGSICTDVPLAPNHATSRTITPSAVRGQSDHTVTSTTRFDTLTTEGRMRTVPTSPTTITLSLHAALPISIVKQTNGSDNNAAPGPLVLVGDPVTWTYQVTNTGNVALQSVAVTDD